MVEEHYLDLGFARLDATISPMAPAKAGLARLTKQLAVELAELSMGVNGVAPEPVEHRDGKAIRSQKSAPIIMMRFRSTATALRKNWPEAVFFLCSNRTSCITGQVLSPSMAVQCSRDRNADAARQKDATDNARRLPWM